MDPDGSARGLRRDLPAARRAKRLALGAGGYGGVSGDAHNLRGARPVVSEGRAFLQRTAQRFDLIQISLMESRAATAAGAFALSENNLYTLEAYRLHWNRLADSGLVSTSRWIRGPMGIEVPRLLVLVEHALRAEGIRDPFALIAVVQGGNVGTVLMSRSVLGPGAIGPSSSTSCRSSAPWTTTWRSAWTSTRRRSAASRS